LAWTDACPYGVVMTIPAPTAAPETPAESAIPSAPVHDFAATSLRTEHLVLRPFGDADIDAVVDACQDPETQRYVPVPAPYTRSDGETFVRETVPKGRAAGTDVIFGVFEEATGEAVASVGLHRIKHIGAEFGGVGEIGYWTKPSARGRGLMVEAAREVCRWGFEELGLARIEWIAIAGNEPSWRVVEKLGFTREGTLRSWLVHREERHDAWIGSLLRDEARFDQD
jgi:RimJ/RimL family protein N-acetyltransferase